VECSAIAALAGEWAGSEYDRASRGGPSNRHGTQGIDRQVRGAGVAQDFGEQCVGGRTTRAAFRGEELDDGESVGWVVGTAGLLGFSAAQAMVENVRKKMGPGFSCRYAQNTLVPFIRARWAAGNIQPDERYGWHEDRDAAVSFWDYWRGCERGGNGGSAAPATPREVSRC